MGIFELFQKKKQSPREQRASAIFRRMNMALEEAGRHDPAVMLVQLNPVDMQSFISASGREAPQFPKKLKEIRVEEGRRSVLILADESVISI